MFNQRSLLIAAGALVLGLLLVAWKRGAGQVGQDIGRAAGEAAAGVVVGVGEAIGIPATDLDRCARAKAEGNGWDASFYCPAGDYIQWELDGRPTS